MTNVEQLAAWLRSECGGECNIEYALEHFPIDVLRRAVEEGVCEYRGCEGNEDIALVEGE